MTLEKIINILGKILNKTLVIKRELDTDESFKIFKTYKIFLYEIIKKKDPVILSSIQITDKITDSNKEIIVNKIEEAFLKQILEQYVDRNKQILDPNN